MFDVPDLNSLVPRQEALLGCLLSACPVDDRDGDDGQQEIYSHGAACLHVDLVDHEERRSFAR